MAFKRASSAGHVPTRSEENRRDKGCGSGVLPRESPEARLRRLSGDLEVLEQIQRQRPTLEWDDYDTILVHSAVNMLKNEVLALQCISKLECTQCAAPAEAQTLAAKVKASLRSAGHRTSKLMTLVSLSGRNSPRNHHDARHSAHPLSDCLQSQSMHELFDGCRQHGDLSGSSRPARRHVRFIESQAYSNAGVGMEQGECVGCSEKQHGQPDDVCAVVVGQKMLPLSGTW